MENALISPEAVDVGVQHHLQEWDEEVEDEPDVDHLDVGGLGEAVADGDEEGRQDQEGGQVHGHDGLEVRGSGEEQEDSRRK